MVVTVRDRIMKLAHRRLSALSRKQLLMIGGGVLLVCLVGYIVWSKQVWSDYQTHYTQWQQAVGTDAKKAATLPTGTSNERAKVVVAFDDVARRIATTSQGVCEVNPFIRWQEAVMADLKAKRSSCQTMAKKVVDLQSPLMETSAYLKADASLSDILSGIPQAEELSDADFEKQYTAWSTATDATGKLTAPDAFKPVQQLAFKQVSAVKVAWQALIAANQAKDKKRYLAAQGSLATALDGLDEVSLMSQKSFLAISVKLKTASAIAFET